MSDRRTLGVWSASCLVVANMIGAGVFTTSGFALADLGRPEWVLLAWAVAGGLALCGALSYGAFARRLPESGGEYAFLSFGVHPVAGFLAGWVSLCAGFTAPIAAAGLGLQAYLGDVVASGWRPEWLGTAAIALAAVLHAFRLGAGVALQNAAVLLKVALLVGFVALGWVLEPATAPGRAASDREFSIGAFAVSLVWISYAYSGWNAAVYVAGEVRSPRTHLPRALTLATLGVAALYLGVNAVFLYSAPVSDLAGRAEIGAVAAEALGGPTLRRAVSGLVALALFTSISSMVMAGPRVYARMADDGVFPNWLRTRGRVPVAAIAFQAALATGVLWVSSLAQLLGYIGFALGLSAAATVASLIAVRRREGAGRVPIPGYPWVPLVFVGTTLAVSGFMVAREPLQAGIAVLTIAAGLPVYLWQRRRRARDRRSSPGFSTSRAQGELR